MLTSVAALILAPAAILLCGLLAVVALLAVLAAVDVFSDPPTAPGRQITDPEGETLVPRPPTPSDN